MVGKTNLLCVKLMQLLTVLDERKVWLSRERLETILDDVSRWYNVTVFYEQSRVKDILFSGIVERYSDISETLKMLEKTGKVSFIVDEQKIIVSAR
ncbi:MAG: DUF4974 domain-containing protein [Butyricimonas faecihominis]